MCESVRFCGCAFWMEWKCTAVSVYAFVSTLGVDSCQTGAMNDLFLLLLLLWYTAQQNESPHQLEEEEREGKATTGLTSNAWWVWWCRWEWEWEAVPSLNVVFFFVSWFMLSSSSSSSSSESPVLWGKKWQQDMTTFPYNHWHKMKGMFPCT